jgi:hypothetical protein
MTHLRTLMSSTILTLAFAGAQASTLYTSSAPTAALDTLTAVTTNVSAGAGAGLVTLQLQGYKTLDGDHLWIDIFHLAVNGVDVYRGTWDLGGGGTDRVLLDVPGATATHSGATVDLSIPVSLVGGVNTLSFSYESPTSFEGSGRAGFQSIGDEGWGINSVTVTGTAPVPEPETYGLVLAGLAVMGASWGRRKSAD